MKTSEQGRKAIAKREGTILHVYKDSKGLPTVGVGHLLLPTEKRSMPVGTQITQQESDRLLAADLKECEDAVNGLDVDLKQNEFDALVSLTFNIGVGGFKRSTVVRRLKAGDKKAAASAILLWNKPPEIQGRRRTEYNQFLTPYKNSTAAAKPTPAKPTIKGNSSTDTPTVPPLIEEPSPAAGTPQTSVHSDVIEVTQLKPDAAENIDQKISKWSARWAAIPASITGALFTALAWMKDSPANVIIAGIVTTGSVVGAYFVVRMVSGVIKDARKDSLAEAERNRVHEMMMLQGNSAASQHLNAIKFVPPAAPVDTGNPIPPVTDPDNQI